MRASILALTLLLAPAPAEAACHRFRHWAYPFPQRCGTPQSAARAAPAIAYHAPVKRAPALVLPDMSATWGSEPDEVTKGRLILKAKLATK